MHRLILLSFLLLALTGTPPAQAAPAPSCPAVAEATVPEATLSAAAPNPFSDRTRFSLTVPSTQRVAVDVFSLLGRPVRTLFDGTIQGGDTRTFTFEVGSLPSGLYLYRARGDDFAITRRVLLVR